MKALVKYGNKDGEVEIRDVPIPQPGPDDVLVEVKAVGICGWDIEMWRHRMASPVIVPVIQGHEFCGIISKLGSNVKDFAEGQRVVCETAAVICGKCPHCLSGNYHICPHRKGFGYGVDGAFTNYIKVPQRCLHSIPTNLSFEHACLTEPACVAYHALAVLSAIKPGMPVLVIGPGPIGLFSVQVAKACGAGQIIVVGTDKDKLRFEVAKKLGADMLINASTQNARQIIDDATNGYGIGLVVDAAGNEHALALALHAVGRRGQITKIGWGPKPVNLSLDPLLSKAARLQGTFSHNWATWEAVLAMISRGAIKMEPMISHQITIDEWLPTFEAIERCEGVKGIMLFNQNKKQRKGKLS